MRAPGLPALADWGAGLSIAGLLLPEAVAYSGIAGLPPQAGVIALFAGLLAYGLLGTSRFAIVSATSSSAAVLLAATASMAGTSPQQRMLLAVGIVLLTGLFFVVAGLARLGAVSNFIAKPVLRGFALGLALTIVVKQIPHAVAFQPVHGDLPRFAWELVSGWRHWNAAGLAMAVAALLLMRALARWRGLPAALLVIAAGIALDASGWCARWGIAAVGPIRLRLGELAFAMALILYAESYGSIRTFALRHGDRVDANRDLMALGAANLLSGVFHGMPVGAGYSATSANEVAGAQSRAAGLVACAVVGLAVWLLLPWIESTPEPLLAAIVIHAVGHTLNPAALRPYFAWRRDRLIVVLAFVAVLALGVLDGLLLAIAASLLMLLQTLSRSHVSWLGRLADTHDFVDVARHPDAVVPAGLLIARPEAPLFFGNADPVFAAIRERLRTLGSPTGVVLSLEDSADLDATSVEALCDFAVRLHQDGVPLVLARVKDPVRDLLARVASPALPPACYAGWSVDDAVRQLQAV
jgi:MFS superfamily sulfate permease-like transporter